MSISPRPVNLPFEIGARIFITNFADDDLADRIYDSSRDDWSLLSYSQGDYGSLLNTEVVDLRPLLRGENVPFFEQGLVDRILKANTYLEEAVHAYMPEFGIVMRNDHGIQVYSARGTGITSCFAPKTDRSSISANLCLSHSIQIFFPVLNARLELMFGDILVVPSQFPHYFSIDANSADPVSFMRKELIE